MEWKESRIVGMDWARFFLAKTRRAMKHRAAHYFSVGVAIFALTFVNACSPHFSVSVKETSGPNDQVKSQSAHLSTTVEAHAVRHVDKRNWNSLLSGTREEKIYENVNGYRGTLYLFLPKGSVHHPVPVVVYFHGGSLIHGSAVITSGEKYRKEWVVSSVERSLVQHGFAFASVNYRLAPKYKWPAQIDDALASVRYLKANAQQFGLDPNAMSVMGDSAGGALASLVGVTSVSGARTKVVADSLSHPSSAVQSVVDMFGPVDRHYYADRWTKAHGSLPTPVFGSLTPQRVRSASAISYVQPRDPHFLIVQGLKDTVDPPRYSLDMYDKLRRNHDFVQLILVHNMEHEFLPHGGSLNPSVPFIASNIVEFLEKYGRGPVNTKRKFSV